MWESRRPYLQEQRAGNGDRQRNFENLWLTCLCQPSWEMSTIGHPLSDLANLLSPYTFAVSLPTSTSSALSNRVNAAFIPSAKTPGLPTRDECMTWYAETAGWDPRPEMAWGDAFGVFRNSVIMQGIAARYALRQASSAKAHEYALQMGPFGEFAWWLVGKCIEGVGRKEKAKL